MDQSRQTDHGGPVADECNQWLNSPVFISESDFFQPQQDIFEEVPTEMDPTIANVEGLGNFSDNGEALNNGAASAEFTSSEFGLGFDDPFTPSLWFGVHNEDSCSINTFWGDTVAYDTNASETNKSFTMPHEPPSQEIRDFENSPVCDLLSEPASLGGDQLSTKNQTLKLTESASSEPQPRGRKRANESSIQGKGYTKLVRKAGPRKPTETDKLLGLSYLRYSLNQPKAPRRRDHQNNISLRNHRGQCIRCVYKHRKCNLESPCETCSSDIKRNIELDCVRADVESFNVFVLDVCSISDFFKPKALGQKGRSVAFDVYSCFTNAFVGYEEEPALDSWKLLQAIANLAAGDESSNLSVFWRLCLDESGFQAPNIFIMSSLLLAKPNYLRALAPEQESFMRACRSHASSCLLKIIDRAMRGQLIPTLYCPHCREEISIESTVLFFTTLLRGSMIHLSTCESVFGRRAQDAHQFLERYLTETARLIPQCHQKSQGCSHESSELSVLLQKKDEAWMKHCYFYPDESDLDSYRAFVTPSGFLSPGGPNDYMALVPLSWWESRDYPSLPRLTADDLYYTLTVACHIRSDFGRHSELLHIARRSWARIRKCFASLTDAIVAQIASYRSFPHELFFNDLQTASRSLIQMLRERLEYANMAVSGYEEDSDTNQFIDNPWGGFLKAAYVCSVPVVLMSMRLISWDDLILALNVLSLKPVYRLGATFFLLHPAGLDLLNQSCQIRERIVDCEHCGM